MTVFSQTIQRQAWIIQGIVQGVGFRPWVYRHAKELGLSGWILNNGQGVQLEVQGEVAQLAKLKQALSQDPPPLARIDQWLIEDIACATSAESAQFEIIQSQATARIEVAVSPDKATCRDCLNDMADPDSRFYHYPFTNCTNCGPRYSIIKQLPYDRINTALSSFHLCEACLQDYQDPSNRRYHAQPMSCPACGPQLALLDQQQKLIADHQHAIAHTAKLLLAGKIIAIKGLGGFHLMCDATNHQAVAELRQRKQRPKKPFAVMVQDQAMAAQLVSGEPLTWTVLLSNESPIVLMDKLEQHHAETQAPWHLAEEVAPQISKLGLFLPYTPIHHLLLAIVQRPLVATSANLAGAPIITQADAIFHQLGDVVDYVLDHNRPIINGCDDSVVQVIDDEIQIMRLARGYAPFHLPLPQPVAQPRLAVGAQQKNTIALAQHQQIIVSPHIGDLTSVEAESYFEQTIARFFHLYQCQPRQLCHDQHPDYPSTRWALAHAEKQTQQQSAPPLAVQHHYAHVLSVMAMNQIHHPHAQVLGFSFDGTGLGDDHCLWGGEMLLCSTQDYQHLGQMKPLTLIGMEQAIKQPIRLWLALLFAHYDLPSILAMREQTLAQTDHLQTNTNKALACVSAAVICNLHQLWLKQTRCIDTSSVGRLFDLVAVILGEIDPLGKDGGFEGEAGMKIEALAQVVTFAELPSEFHFRLPRVSLESHLAWHSGVPQWDSHQLMLDLLKQANAAPLTLQRKQWLCAGFIHALAQAVVDAARDYPAYSIALCGGVFQNRLLLKITKQALRAQGHTVLSAKQMPINDAGLALGQLWHKLLS